MCEDLDVDLDVALALGMSEEEKKACETNLQQPQKSFDLNLTPFYSGSAFPKKFQPMTKFFSPRF